MSGVVSLSCFLKSSNGLRLMILNAKKMTPLWPLGIMCLPSFALKVVVRACADVG